MFYIRWLYVTIITFYKQYNLILVSKIKKCIFKDSKGQLIWCDIGDRYSGLSFLNMMSRQLHIENAGLKKKDTVSKLTLTLFVLQCACIWGIKAKWHNIFYFAVQIIYSIVNFFRPIRSIVIAKDYSTCKVILNFQRFKIQLFNRFSFLS